MSFVQALLRPQLLTSPLQVHPIFLQPQPLLIS